jgi:hypothetical protein
MPYINSRVSVSLSKEKEVELKERLGKAIEAIPGKTETWLMVDIEDNCKLYFGGDNSKPMAYVDVKVLGSENKAAFNAMTGVLCDVYKDVLGISPDKVYVTYQALANWGFNGSNF